VVDFAEFVESESRGLVAAVYAIVGDRHRAEEIVQDAFERCFRRWRRVSRLDRPGAWARRVAINAAISSARRSSSEQRAVRRLTAVSDRHGADPVDRLLSVEDEALWAAVRALPGDQAAAIALRYGADVGVEDIAASLHLTVPAVKSLLHRARTTLRTSPALQPYTEREQSAP
jgi:RNA polymerase sigma factor (sigma-70 family)